jgi:hypothetical protein
MGHRSAFLQRFTNLTCYVLPTLLLVVLSAVGAQAQQSGTTFPLDSIAGLEVFNGKAEIATYRGRRALHLVAPAGRSDPEDSESVHAFIAGLDFKNGTIEVDVAGAPLPGAPEGARGFIGVDFRSQDHGERTESMYLRPTNGRVDDQLRRNHSVQYDSIPDFPWFRLRKESPGVYESYADLEPGAWTRMKIVVSGTKAELYVNGSEQPCLIVNDLKLGDSHGQIGVWGEWSTDAYFSNLTIRNDR